jgi:hypothetical protein
MCSRNSEPPGVKPRTPLPPPSPTDLTRRAPRTRRAPQRWTPPRRAASLPTCCASPAAPPPPPPAAPRGPPTLAPRAQGAPQQRRRRPRRRRRRRSTWWSATGPRCLRPRAACWEFTSTRPAAAPRSSRTFDGARARPRLRAALLPGVLVVCTRGGLLVCSRGGAGVVFVPSKAAPSTHDPPAPTRAGRGLQALGAQTWCWAEAAGGRQERRRPKRARRPWCSKAGRGRGEKAGRAGTGAAAQGQMQKQHERRAWVGVGRVKSQT